MSTMTGLLAGGAALVGATLLAKHSSGSIEGCGCGLAQSADGEEQEMFFGSLGSPRRRKTRKKAKRKAKKKTTRKKAKRKTSRKKKARRRSMGGLSGGTCGIMRTPSGPRCYCNKKFAKMSACGR